MYLGENFSRVWLDDRYIGFLSIRCPLTFLPEFKIKIFELDGGRPWGTRFYFMFAIFNKWNVVADSPWSSDHSRGLWMTCSSRPITGSLWWPFIVKFTSIGDSTIVQTRSRCSTKDEAETPLLQNPCISSPIQIKSISGSKKGCTLVPPKNLGWYAPKAYWLQIFV